MLAIMVWLVGGCTTQSYAPASAAVTRELKIKAGDEIRVITTRRERLSFKVSEVRGDRFIGVTAKPHAKELHPAGETVEVPFDELAVLEVTRFETRRGCPGDGSRAGDRVRFRRGAGYRASVTARTVKAWKRVRHRVPKSTVMLVACLLLGACTYQHTLRHPKLPPLVPSDRTMDCRQIDLAIDRADTVRWLIRDDGGSLETSGHSAARYAGNAHPDLAHRRPHPDVHPDDGGHTVLDAADERIRELLQLKRDRGCAPRATTVPGKDDLALLAELETVQAQLAGNHGEQGALYAQRTKLLDGLRVVPPPRSNTP